MTLQELADAINLMCDRASDDISTLEVVIPYAGIAPSIGPARASPVESFYRGIDWNRSRIFIQPAVAMTVDSEAYARLRDDRRKLIDRLAWCDMQLRGSRLDIHAKLKLAKEAIAQALNRPEPPEVQP